MAPDVAAAEPEAVPSGTVVLLRTRPALEALVMRRGVGLRFMGGYWVFPGGTVDPEDGRPGAARPAIDAAAAAAARELREEAGVEVDPADLAHFAHWITPTGTRRRFDTHFFVALAPGAAVARVASPESTDVRWLAPADAAADRDGLALTPPTRFVLREIAEEIAAGGSLEAFLATLPERTVHTVLPKLSADGYAVMPWDVGYDAVPGQGLPWPSDAVAARSRWPGRVRAIVERVAPAQ